MPRCEHPVTRVGLTGGGRTLRHTCLCGAVVSTVTFETREDAQDAYLDVRADEVQREHERVGEVALTWSRVTAAPAGPVEVLEQRPRWTWRR